MAASSLEVVVVLDTRFSLLPGMLFRCVGVEVEFSVGFCVIFLDFGGVDALVSVSL